MIALAGHLVLALALLGSYVGLTVAGHDGNVLLGFLGGQLSAIGIDKLATSGTRR